MAEIVARLIEAPSRGPERTHELGVGVHVIGREAGVDVVVDHVDVSRRHATLSVAADGAAIRDLDSKNGLVVDGQKRREAPLCDGSRVRIGELELRFEHRGTRVDRLLLRSGELTARRPRAAAVGLEFAGPQPSLVPPLLASLAFAILITLLLVFG